MTIFAGTTSRLIDGPGSEWSAIEQRLGEAGVSIPLPARLAWARRDQVGRRLLMLIEASDGTPKGAVGLVAHRSRAVPGHLLVRAERVGANFDDEMMSALADGLLELARALPRVLRVTVELVGRNAAEVERRGRILAERAFLPVSHPRRWTNTLVIDLRPSEDEILAGFSAKTRRDLRAASRAPVVVRRVADPALAPRLQELIDLTLTRTGGHLPAEPWDAVIALSEEIPNASRLVALHRAGDESPSGLLAFAWGCAHGDHAHYDAAASVRAPDLRVPLMYPLLWDLVLWAKAGGASWFDLGGVTAGSVESDDPLGGISDFKRWFSKDLATVGAEWEFEPSPLRAKVARAVSRLARGF